MAEDKSMRSLEWVFVAPPSIAAAVWGAWHFKYLLENPGAASIAEGFGTMALVLQVFFALGYLTRREN